MSTPNRDEVIKNLKTCIQSSKGGVPISNLSRDYHMLIGDPLPFRGLGHSKLEDLIRSVSDLKLISGPKGDLIVQSVANERGDHLARIVALQRGPNNARSAPKPTRKTNENNPKKPWTRATQNPPSNNRSLRTPSLLRNMSQPTASASKNHPPMHRSFSNPGGNKFGGGHSAEPTPSTNKIPPLLSVDTSAVAPMMRFPNISLDKRKPDTRNPRRLTGSSGRVNNNNNNIEDEVMYSPIVSPAASVKKPTVPTTEIKATKHISTLKKYVAENKLGEIEFKTIEMVTGPTKQYISSVSIGKDFKVSTYPNGGSTTQEALELAAQLAYETLVAKFSAPQPNLPATQNTSEALKRILKILEAHPNGVWASKVPDEYTSLYGEQLPADWLQQTMDCPQVDPNVISDKQIILVLAETTDTTPVIDDKKGAMKNDVTNGKTENYVEEITNVADSKVEEIKSEDSNKPPPLILPRQENWDVYVTNANSTTEVWLRLVGDDYSSMYENLATEMELHYLEHGAAASDVLEGCYYALNLDDCVHRVQVATVTKGEDEVHCLLLDHGQVEHVSISQLQDLDPKFLRLPFQAVQCELQGLEQLRGGESEVESVHALLLDTIIGKTFVAQPTSQVLGSMYSVGSPSIALRLFDTSTDEDVDVNQQLWEAITSRVLLPQLPREGRVVEVMISHVAPEAQIYVQLHTVVLLEMQERIGALNPEAQPKGSVLQTVSGKFYLAPAEDSTFHRAIVTSSLSDDMVEVMFVDFGNSAPVPKSQLIDLQKMSPAINRIPAQAVLCRMHNILPCAGARITERTIARLIQLLPSDKTQLLKVVGAALPNTPASVELFRRLEPDNLLVSLNNTIAMDQELFDLNDVKVEKEQQTKEIKATINNEAVSRVLSQPKVPDIGGSLDIHVTLAASPGNFVVQPWDMGPELEELMIALQSLYGAGDGPHLQPLASSDIREGGIYVARHSDGKWYRVQVNNLLKGDQLTVFFVDFGDHTVMTLDKLRPLAAKFCKLPCQAIKAKLSGIRPKHSDWSVEDCMRFQALVVNRQFVSVVKETGPDLINPSDTVLGLQLIDTSDDKVDVDIGELFVKEQRAAFIS